MTNMLKHHRVLELDKVLGMLENYTVSEDAAKLVRETVPASSYGAAVRLTGYTADANMLSNRFGYPNLLKIKNCHHALKRANMGSALSLRELLDVLQVLRTIRNLSNWHSQTVGFHTSLDPLFESLFVQKSLEDRLAQSIISDEELDDNASAALSDIRRKIRTTGMKIRTQLDSMIKSPNIQKYLQDPIVTIRDGRFVVPVKAEHRSEVKGLVHDTSSSGATFFIEPMSVVEANNEIKVLESKEQQEIERIIAELSALVGDNCEAIAASYDAVVELDLYFAKSKLGDRMRASIPVFNDEGKTILKKARHPLIDATKVVPIDIAVGDSYDTLVITGPNTGGKTVAIKTLGLIVLMAMCGMMIPASDGSVVSVYQDVLSDIGDEQSIEQSLSTFSSHMVNIISIIDKASLGSLVLLDELGAGTDPVEGAALAVSIIEKLRAKGAKIAATTHYPEIKMFALDTPGVENASCEFDLESLRPTYRLLTGVPGRSNAFLISEKLGLPKEIIEGAKEHISQDNTRFEDIVTELEQARQSLEQEKRAASIARQETEAIKAQAIKQQKALETSMEKELEKAREQARDMIDEIRIRSQILFEELDAIKKEKDKENFVELLSNTRREYHTSLNEMEELSAPGIKTNNEHYVLPRPLQGGDIVFVRSMNKEAIVIKTPAAKATKVQIQAGIIKAAVSIGELVLVDKTKPSTAHAKTAKKVSFKGVTSKTQRNAKTELDIRGYDSEQGVMELDAFIDNAVMSGINMIRIIHGKGTGVLRAAVAQRLKNHRHVASFRLGVYGEGESGVTIAELK